MNTNLIRAKARPKSPAADAADDPLHLETEVRRLLASDAVLLKAQLELEKSDTSKQWVPEDRYGVEARALRMLAGDDPEDAVKAAPEHGRYAAIRHAREAIARAVEIGRHKAIQGWLQRSMAQAAQREGEWRANLRQTAIALCTLLRLNRERVALQKQIRGRADPTLFPPMLCQEAASPQLLLGCGLPAIAWPDPGHNQTAHAFLSALVRNGVMTAREVSKALDIQEDFKP